MNMFVWWKNTWAFVNAFIDNNAFLEIDRIEYMLKFHDTSIEKHYFNHDLFFHSENGDIWGDKNNNKHKWDWKLCFVV